MSESTTTYPARSHNDCSHPHRCYVQNGRTRDELVAEATIRWMGGETLFAIAMQLGVTKEWLRTYAGIGR